MQYRTIFTIRSHSVIQRNKLCQRLTINQVNEEVLVNMLSHRLASTGRFAVDPVVLGGPSSTRALSAVKVPFARSAYTTTFKSTGPFRSLCQPVSCLLKGRSVLTITLTCRPDLSWVNSDANRRKAAGAYGVARRRHPARASVCHTLDPTPAHFDVKQFPYRRVNQGGVFRWKSLHQDELAKLKPFFP